MEKIRPHTYDMTFCVSKCRNKCRRHYSLYKFEKGYITTYSNFDCEKRGIHKKFKKMFEENK